MFSFLYERLLHQVENDSIFSRRHVYYEKSVFLRLSIWQCTESFVTLTKLAGKLLVVDKESNSQSSDHPKGVSTAID